MSFATKKYFENKVAASCVKAEGRNAPTKLSETSDKTSAVEDKRMVEQYKNLISLKIKDPDFAKKAALIVENMLNPFPRKK